MSGHSNSQGDHLQPLCLSAVLGGLTFSEVHTAATVKANPICYSLSKALLAPTAPSCCYHIPVYHK